MFWKYFYFSEIFSQLKLIDYVILLVHIYSLAGNDVFYGKEEKDRTHVNIQNSIQLRKSFFFCICKKMIGKEILNDSSFTNTLRAEMKSKIKKSQSIILKKCFSSALGYSLEIEHALDLIYQQLDLLLSYKRRYKHLKFVF